MMKAEENVIIQNLNLVMTASVHCLCPAMDALAKMGGELFHFKSWRRAVSLQHFDKPLVCFKHTV